MPAVSESIRVVHSNVRSRCSVSIEMTTPASAIASIPNTSQKAGRNASPTAWNTGRTNRPTMARAEEATNPASDR